jgi:hypothetical protein
MKREYEKYVSHQQGVKRYEVYENHDEDNEVVICYAMRKCDGILNGPYMR